MEYATITYAADHRPQRYDERFNGRASHGCARPIRGPWHCCRRAEEGRGHHHAEPENERDEDQIWDRRN